MNAECYCNFQSNLNVGSRESCFVTIGEDTSRYVYFVSILVLLYRIRSFFHLILLSYFIDFVSFLTLQISSLLFVGFRFLTLQISFHFVGFRFLTLQISLDFVFVPFRFVSFRFSVYRYPETDLEGGVRGVRPPKIRKAYVIQR
jgi:hypothetical protein